MSDAVPEQQEPSLTDFLSARARKASDLRLVLDAEMQRMTGGLNLPPGMKLPF